MIDLTGGSVLLQWGSLAAAIGCAFYVGRKSQQVQSGIIELKDDVHRLAAITEEHCSRLAVLEAILEERSGR